MAAGCNPFDLQFPCSSSPGGARAGWPCSPDLYCNLSRSLLQLTFPGKYQLWPPAGRELKGSSANLTGPVRCHLAGREGGRQGGTDSVCLPSCPPAHMPSRHNSLLITLRHRGTHADWPRGICSALRSTVTGWGHVGVSVAEKRRELLLSKSNQGEEMEERETCRWA